MAYRLRITRAAQHDIDGLAAYLHDCSERLAVEQIDRLNHVLSVNIAESPLTWGSFVFSGAPYRAYLFRIGRRTQYWIVSQSTKKGARLRSFASGMRPATPILSNGRTRASVEE